MFSLFRQKLLPSLGDHTSSVAEAALHPLSPELFVETRFLRVLPGPGQLGGFRPAPWHYPKLHQPQAQEDQLFLKLPPIHPGPLQHLAPHSRDGIPTMLAPSCPDVLDLSREVDPGDEEFPAARTVSTLHRMPWHIVHIGHSLSPPPGRWHALAPESPRGLGAGG